MFSNHSVARPRDVFEQYVTYTLTQTAAVGAWKPKLGQGSWGKTYLQEILSYLSQIQLFFNKFSHI